MASSNVLFTTAFDALQVHQTIATISNHPWITLATSVCTVLVLWFVTSAIIRPYIRYRFYKRQGIPTLPHRPIIGNLPEIAKLTKTPYGNAYDKKFGPIYYFSMGPEARLTLNDPELAKEVLVTKADCFVKPELMRKALGPLLGDGLLLVDGAQHKRQRKVVSPAFHFHNLKDMMPGMVDCTASAVNDWLAKVKGNSSTPLEMHRELSSLTLSIVLRGVFGSRFPDGMTPDVVYNGTSAALKAVMSNILSGMFLVPGWRSLPTAANRAAFTGTARIKDMVDSIIKQRREAMAAEGVAAAEGEGAGQQDLLRLLLLANEQEHNDATSAGNTGSTAAKGCLTDTELRDVAVTFIMAGHETTAQLIGWTLVMLSQHPQWIQRLRGEVDEVLEGGRAPVYGDLAHMPIVNAVLNETLRHLPPAANVVRACVKDVKIGTYQVSKGTTVRISPFSIHHDPQLWDNPDEWHPERFTGPGGVRDAVKHKLAFMPFSAGRADCVGRNFAMLEARTILAMLVQRMDFRLDESYRHHPEFAITLRPRFGVPMHVAPRGELGCSGKEEEHGKSV